MIRPVICLDVDGIVFDFSRAFLKVCRKMYLRPGKSYVSPIDWEYSDSGLTPDEIALAMKEVSATENFWLSLPAYSGVDCLKRWSGEYDIQFVTHRVETRGWTAVEQTCKALQDWTGLRHPQVLVVPPDKEKGPIVAALDAIGFLDDKVENLQSVAAASPKTVCVLQRRSWNIPGAFPLVNTLDEFFQMVKGV